MMNFFRALFCAFLLVLLSSCGGGGNPANPVPPPSTVSVSVSPSSSNVLLGDAQQFTASVTGSSNTAVSWSVNGIAGGNPTVGTISPAGLYTAPQKLPSPANVSITATSQADPSKAGNAAVTVTSDITVTVTTNPANAQVVQTSGTLQLTANLSSAGNPDKGVTWTVNGIANGNSTVGTTTITGANTATYTAPANPPSPNTVTITATSAADSSRSASLSVPVASPVQITSLDKTTVDPLTPVTITGSGFDPANAAISVLLIPESGGLRISVPAFAATGTTIQIMVPPFLNTMTGTFTAGTMDAQVTQLDGKVLSTSNVFTGLQVNAPPVIPAGLATGAITSAFLHVSLNVSSSVQGAAVTNSKLINLATDLAKYANDLSALIPAINTVTNNPGQSVTVTTANGSTFTLDAKVLALSDQLIWTYVHQFVNQTGTPLVTLPSRAGGGTDLGFAQTTSILAQTTTSCPVSLGDAFGDQFMCTVQQYHQNLATTGAQAVQLGAKIEIGFYLSFLGGWVADGLAGAGAVGETAAKAIEMGWSNASSLIASYVTASQPPSLSDSLKNAAAEVLDDAALGGIGILPAAVDARDMYEEASKIVASSAGSAPEGGLVLTGSQNNAPSGTTAVVGFQSSNGVPTTAQLAAPSTQQVTGTSSVTIAPPPSFALTVSVGGTSSGSVGSFPSGISCGTTCTALFPSGTTVSLSANPRSNSTLQSWGGVCSGTGACVVVMNSNQSVSATFGPQSQTPVTYAGSFTGTVVDHGNGGCPGSADLNGTGSVTVKPSASGTGFDFTGSVTVTQGPGICDNYSGTFSVSGSVASINGGSVTFPFGFGTATGTFSGNTFSGTWGFSQSIGPDVAIGTFSLTKQ